MVQFNQVLQRELNAIEKEKDEFVEDFSEVRLAPYFLKFYLMYLIYVEVKNSLFVNFSCLLSISRKTTMI